MNEATYVDGFHYKNEVSKMVYNPLGKTGLRVSKISLGCSPFGGTYEPFLEEEAYSIIKESLKCGINYIDTAPSYGQGKSEAILGKALRSIPRKAYYIGTKVGRYTIGEVENMFDFSAKTVREKFERSLELLGLDYVDLIQVHDPEYAEDLDQIINETLPAVKKLVDEGKARFIGVNAYPLAILKDIVERSSVKIDTILCHSRCNLINNDLENYVPYFQSKGIGIISAAPLSMGLLTHQGPQAWHPRTEEIAEAVQKAKKFCQEKNKDIAYLAIQYSFGVQGISTHLLGAAKNEYMKQNLKASLENTSKENMHVIKELRERYFEPLTCKNWEGNDYIFKKLEEFRKKKSMHQSGLLNYEQR